MLLKCPFVRRALGGCRGLLHRASLGDGRGRKRQPGASLRVTPTLFLSGLCSAAGGSGQFTGGESTRRQVSYDQERESLFRWGVQIRKIIPFGPDKAAECGFSKMKSNCHRRVPTRMTPYFWPTVGTYHRFFVLHQRRSLLMSTG